MRRSDREIVIRSEIDEVIRGSMVCHLAFAAGGEPYIVPVSFGYDGIALYFHTAKTGRKIDCIEENPRACFEFECNVELGKDEGDACAWTFSYESVVGYGTVSELVDVESKMYGLNQIMLQYSGREWRFEQSKLNNMRVWRLQVETATGKRSLQERGVENI